MKKENFPFVIGYSGETSMLDRTLKNKLGRCSARELADAGQYKAAFCLAMYTGEEDKAYIAGVYNAKSGASYQSEDLMRLFGVFYIPPFNKTRAL